MKNGQRIIKHRLLYINIIKNVIFRLSIQAFAHKQCIFWEIYLRREEGRWVFRNTKANKEIFKWPREMKRVRGKREILKERKEGWQAQVKTRGNMRLTLYSGYSIISREGSVQFSKQTDSYKVLQAAFLRREYCIY